jgi:group I intron endonuclease
MYIIYQTTNTANKEIYVGFTTRNPVKRWREHLSSVRKGSRTYFHSAIRKYGAENFSTEVLEEGWDPEIGKNIREPYWISVLKPGYNGTKGGDGILGYKRTDDFKQKLSVRMLGKQYGKGYKHTDKFKQEQASRMTGKQYGLGHSHKHSEVQNRLHSEFMTGKQYALGYKYTKEQSLALSIRQRNIAKPKVACPHCQLTGGNPIMRRYHFDRCKHKGAV